MTDSMLIQFMGHGLEVFLRSSAARTAGTPAGLPPDYSACPGRSRARPARWSGLIPAGNEHLQAWPAIPESNAV